MRIIQLCKFNAFGGSSEGRNPINRGPVLIQEGNRGIWKYTGYASDVRDRCNERSNAMETQKEDQGAGARDGDRWREWRRGKREREREEKGKGGAKGGKNLSNIPAYTFIYLHIPSYTFIYLHIPSYTYIYFVYPHMPPNALIYPQIPSYT